MSQQEWRLSHPAAPHLTQHHPTTRTLPRKYPPRMSGNTPSQVLKALNTRLTAIGMSTTEHHRITQATTGEKGIGPILLSKAWTNQVPALLRPLESSSETGNV